MTDNRALDPAALERLQRLGGAKFTGDMIDLFLSYGAKKVADTQEAANLEAVAMAAHPLKSSAGNVGAVRVAELAAALEQSAKRQDAEQSKANVAELVTAFAEVKTLLEAERARLGK